MKLKNRTSTMAVEKIIGKIELRLVGIGCSEIVKTYDGHGRPDSIIFTAMVPDHGRMSFRIPVRVKEAEVILAGAQKRRSRYFRRESKNAAATRIQMQAERTAWKCVLDWVEAQSAMIMLGQAEAVEIFLPYVWKDGNTFYQRIKHQFGYALLEGGKK